MQHLDTQPSDATQESWSETNSEIIRQGRAALDLHLEGRKWDAGVAIARALGVGREMAMREANTNRPRGPRYNKAIACWLRTHRFDRLDKSDRSRYLECLDNLDAIEAWRSSLSEEERERLQYVPNVLRAWKRAMRPAQELAESADSPACDDADIDVGTLLSAYDASTWWNGALAAERTRFLENIDFNGFVRALPAAWRPKLAERVLGVRAKSPLAVKAAHLVTSILLKDPKVRTIVTDAGLELADFRVVFEAEPAREAA
jgi:hypothetical protein